MPSEIDNSKKVNSATPNMNNNANTFNQNFNQNSQRILGMTLNVKYLIFNKILI